MCSVKLTTNMWKKLLVISLFYVSNSSCAGAPPAVLASLLGFGVSERCPAPKVPKGTKLNITRSFNGIIKAEVTCKIGYEFGDKYNSTKNYIHCEDDEWIGEIPTCEQRCGQLGIKFNLDRKFVLPGEVPWNVAIYNKDNIPFTLVCGGSIVSDNAVITAASCFWIHTQERKDKSRYIVKAGSRFQDWNRNQVSTQTSEIDEIIYPYLYLSELANYQEDISIVILAMPFKFNNFISPICIKFDRKFIQAQEKNGKLGKIVGWGLDVSNRNPLETRGDEEIKMMKINTPYINRETCDNRTEKSDYNIFTRDKICAGEASGTRLCSEDRGGGFAFLEDERYYLRGVITPWVPSQIPNSDGNCQFYDIIYMTDVAAHKDFLTENLAL